MRSNFGSRVVMADTVKPIKFSTERWMRMPGVPTGPPTGTPGDLFAFSGFADFTGGQEPLTGVGTADTKSQETWVEYNVVEMRVGPHWLRVQGICRAVFIGGHSQVSPDVADAMGFRVQGITSVDVVETSPGVRRIQLGVNVVVRGGFDATILSLGYHVTAWGTLANPIGNEGVFFTGASDPT
jgi:hypothetical protein